MSTPGSVSEPAARVAVPVADAVADARIWIDDRDISRPETSSRLVAVIPRPRPALRWSAPRVPVDVTITDIASGDIAWSAGGIASSASEVDVDLREHTRYRVTLTDASTGTTLAQHEAATAFFPTSSWLSPWVELATGQALRTHLPAAEVGDRVHLHLAAQGLVYAEVEGTPVNAGALDSTRTHQQRTLYRTYDITDLVQSEPVDLVIECGQGAWSRSGEPPRAIAQVTYHHVDASVTHQAIDGELVTGRVTVDMPFYQESHDLARRGAPINAPVARLAKVPTVLSADPTPPTHVVQEHRAVHLHTLSTGTYVFDAGTNSAGRALLSIVPPLPARRAIRVTHGEVLAPDGDVDTTNITMPFDDGRSRQNFEVTGDGHSDGLAPLFAYYGFRYVAVHDVPAGHTVTVTVQTLHTDLRRSATVATNSPTLNTLLTRASRTQLNNLHGVPEDCPTREQAAWTGDVASAADYLFSEYDATTLMSNWVQDLLLSAGPDGVIPAVAPDLRVPAFPGEPVWGSALHRVLHAIAHRGEAGTAVAEALPGLRAWALTQLSWRDERGVVAGAPTSYGQDWLALEQTPPELLHTAATIECLEVLKTLEEEFGDRARITEWAAHQEALRAALRTAFWDEATGLVGTDSQTGYACAIQSGSLTGVAADRAADALAAHISRRGLLITGGFAGVRHIVGALAAHGYHQLLFDVLRVPAEPGIGAMLASGPGTFWECWWRDSTNTGTGSLDHIGLGAPFAAWVWQDVLGLRRTAFDGRSFTLTPANITGIDTLDASVETAHGTLRVRVDRVDEHTVDVRLSSPAGVDVTCVDSDGSRRFSGGEATMRLRPSSSTAVIAGPRERWNGYPQATYSQHVPLAPSALAAHVVVHGDAETGTVELVPNPRCMPIPHAQVAGVGWRVAARDAPPILRLEPAGRALPAGRYYALLDTCDGEVTAQAEAVMSVHLASGRILTATARIWPAGLNRVCVDVDLRPDDRIVAFEVQARLASRPGPDDRSTAYTVVSLGRDLGPRTW